MGILAKVGAAMQRVFGEVAQEAADESGVIKRTRIFTPMSLAKTFVLGFLQNPRASDEKLAQMAAQCGAAVTPQAIEKRHTPALAAFMQKLFCQAAKIIVGSDKALASLLERFEEVILLDSSTNTLPDELEEEFRGCGGSHGSGAAAVKFQTEFCLRSGALTCVDLEQGRSPDGASSRQQVRRKKGSLRISDLGYFNVAVFATMMMAGEHFLSRLQYGTHVLLTGGEDAVDLLPWLEKQRGPFVDQSILLGKTQRLGCRLIAWRLPEEQANLRRQKLRQETKEKRGSEPCEGRMAFCDWTILVTSLPLEMLAPKEAVVLYRARWQVELLFKRWKSQGLIAELSGSTVARQMVRVWSRMLAVLMQQWITVGTIWGDPTKSLSKAFEAIRGFAGQLAEAMNDLAELERVLGAIAKTLEKTCRRDPRSKPGTFELVNEPERLEFRLS